MAVKASVTITISKYRDTDSVTRYYKLQASTAAAPAVPTTLTPSGWSTSEPTYTSGSTNTLYYTDCIVFSDGTFQYTDDGNGKAVKSSSYEAAKEAYNKAQAAQNAANATQENLDNLEIGGRNLLLNSTFDKDLESWPVTQNTATILNTGGYDGKKACQLVITTTGTVVPRQPLKFTLKKGKTLWLSVKIKTVSGNADNLLARIISTITFNFVKKQQLNTDWYLYTYKYTATSDITINNGFGFYQEAGTFIIDDLKMEIGTKYTDWSPAPEDMNDAIKSVVNLYYASDSSTPPAKPTAHVTTNSVLNKAQWNIALPTYDEDYPYLYTCKEILNKGGTYSWTTVNQTSYAEAIKNIQGNLATVQSDYVTDTTFRSYKNTQEATDLGITNRLSRTEVTIYGDPDLDENPDALVNKIQEVESNAADAQSRIGVAEETLENTGLNDYDQRIKITQRFLNVETDVESIKNIFKITGGTNLLQNSVGYFADNDNKPTMWNIAANTIYTPFGYDGDLTGVTISRGKLYVAKGSITTSPNNITALLTNKMMSISFKYKNGANATSKITVFNGSVVFFEKTITGTNSGFVEYSYNPDTDPVLANPTFACTTNSLQIKIESANSNNTNGIEISDLMLNYGDVKPWELCSNEVYGAMVKLSSLGIEVTATTARTKNFMTTDGILVFQYDPQTDTIGDLITKITDNGTVTNKLESTGDIIERDLINTMIKDSSNNNVYVEYIR